MVTDTKFKVGDRVEYTETVTTTTTGTVRCVHNFGELVCINADDGRRHYEKPAGKIKRAVPPEPKDIGTLVQFDNGKQYMRATVKGVYTNRSWHEVRRTGVVLWGATFQSWDDIATGDFKVLN